nr:MAG TPA: Single strand binding protein [Caudoviricetes sp.]
MAKGFSKAVVMGNLVCDPETKQTNSGHSVTSFTLAVNGRNDDVAYIDCTAWNKGGETIAQYLYKGDPLLVSGRLNQSRWQDKDGNNRSRIGVVVDEFAFIGGKNNSDGSSTQTAPQANYDEPAPVSDINIADIPF